MSTTEKKPLFSHEDMMIILEKLYQKVLDGIPHISPSIEQLSKDYLEKYPTKEKAAKAMINNQIIKCTTSGFITGFGGVITLPVSIPANVGSVLYVQMRMIACCAYMAGFDLKSDQTQTFVYACLAGVAVNKLVKQFGIKFGVKLATSLIKKIPGKVLVKINQKVGFRFLTKFGSKGLVNLGKLLPGVGALVGGSLDLVETTIIGNRAYKWFLEGDFSNDKESDDDCIIDVEVLSEEEETLEKSKQFLPNISEPPAP